MTDFRTAVEARDPSAIAATLAETVVFRSPVAFKPYRGKALTAAILRGVLRVFEDFRYVRELSGGDGRDHALVFTARIGDVAVEGCDFLHLDDDGLIDEFTVMVRPLSAAQTLAAAMAAQFDRIQQEAAIDSPPQAADAPPQAMDSPRQATDAPRQ
ncbi:nuclear transport factor 2 family protein [Actinoplanes sp. RD1]|uniref:nuclear transport factor 2 family protein n=1 Tax=Actinoplanes sp. RD1 TaxID=3064538 RepID=UPI0027425539|nr:nuclear transport factor 2 family protein [Actinoplanes sp. RD1]